MGIKIYMSLYIFFKDFDIEKELIVCIFVVLIIILMINFFYNDIYII